MSTSQAQRERISSAIGFLCERFPKAFSREVERIKPLKPDILLDIIQVLHLHEHEASPFRQALYAYRSWTAYLTVVAYGRRYHNVWGDHAGRVTDAERAQARDELIRRGAWKPYHQRKYDERPLRIDGQ